MIASQSCVSYYAEATIIKSVKIGLRGIKWWINVWFIKLDFSNEFK